MKKIELQDLDPSQIEQTNISNFKFIAPKEPKEKQKTDFFSITPTSDFEKSLFKKSYLQKAKENQIIAQFDSKMRRIKNIKSKSYRKIRRHKMKIEDESRLEPKKLLDKFEGDSSNNNGENNNIENEISDESDKNEYKNIPKRLLRKLTKEKEVGVTENNVFEFHGNSNDFKPTAQQNLVSQLFDNQNEFAEAFKEEKQRVVENDLPVDDVQVLPGWGSWGGNEIITEKTKYNTIYLTNPGIKNEERKDFNSHVIINENLNEIDDKYKIEMPFGYTEKEMDIKMNLKISKEWGALKILEKVKDKDGYRYNSKYK